MTRVSVIIPVFNGEKYIAEAIESILAQEIKDIEIIVVDDGSTDGTSKVVALYDLIYVFQENQGPAAARNSGINLATGEYVTFLDSDDRRLEGTLARQLNYLDSYPEADLIQGKLQYLRLINQKWEVCDQPFSALSTTTTLFRGMLFDHFGCFDIELKYCEDIDWFCRARRQGITAHHMADVITHYRRHEHNLTNRVDLIKKYTLHALLKHKRSQTR